MSRMAAGTGRRPHPLGTLQWGHRVGLAFVLFGLVVALFSAGGGRETHFVRSEATEHVTLAPGQTLWDVAVTHAPPDSDPRAYLLQLREANGLDGGPVPAWTVVLLPDPHARG